MGLGAMGGGWACSAPGPECPGPIPERRGVEPDTGERPVAGEYPADGSHRSAGSARQASRLPPSA